MFHDTKERQLIYGVSRHWVSDKLACKNVNRMTVHCNWYKNLILFNLMTVCDRIFFFILCYFLFAVVSSIKLAGEYNIALSQTIQGLVHTRKNKKKTYNTTIGLGKLWVLKAKSKPSTSTSTIKNRYFCTWKQLNQLRQKRVIW